MEAGELICSNCSASIKQGDEFWFEETTSPIQFLFYAIAIWEAFSVPAARKLKVQSHVYTAEAT